MMNDLKRGKHSFRGREQKVDYYIINQRYILLYSGVLDVRSYSVPTFYSLTATELKKQEGLWSKPEIMFEIKLANGSVAKIFEKPIRFNAQTYDDMDYRKEWEGGDMVYEGNNYGDTSTFFIVGTL